MNIKIISVDLQKDFSAEGGKHYKPRPAVGFIKNTLVPYLAEKNIKIAEIVSDYRLPRPADRDDSCNPGTWGYKYEIPDSIKEKPVWVKCMNSPIWIRENIGDSTKQPGLPYQDPKKFSEWIDRVIGKSDNTEIILIGLTLDCCVHCTAQEFNFRGFKVRILKEAVDTYSGEQADKEILCKNPVKNWAEIITWEEAQKLLK